MQVPAPAQPHATGGCTWPTLNIMENYTQSRRLTTSNLSLVRVGAGAGLAWWAGLAGARLASELSNSWGLITADESIHSKILALVNHMRAAEA